jgi:hypothetical protein
VEGYSRAQFVEEYVDLMDQGRAALFCGAGTSIPVGMKDWISLLTGIASKLRLQVEFVSDLVELAQFNFNERGTRNEIHELIMNEYARRAKPGPLHEHLIRLPIDTIWTTNYDKVIEHAFQENGMRPDVKVTAGSLAAHPRLWDVQIFKMHGDVDDPDNAVLTKADYDEYPFTSRGRAFLASLEVAMMSQTFFFLGFSFNDPNIDHVLGRLSVMHGRGQRMHYCVMRRPSVEAAGPNRNRDEHNARLAELRIQDWKKRFSIETVLVDDYNEIPDLLHQLARASRRNHVFVSGAAHDYQPLGEDRLIRLAQSFGKRLAREEKFLISGFGINIGHDVVQGYFDEAYAHEARDLTDRAVVRPFPQRIAGDGVDHNARWTRYRRDMIRQVGFVVYISGNKLVNGRVVPSTGVREEFAIAQAFGAVPVPIGMTGSVAAEIWSEVLASPNQFYGSTDVGAELETLGDVAATDDDVIDAVFRLMDKVVRSDALEPS